MYQTIDICQDIAEKLRSPESVRAMMEESRGKETFFMTKWPNLTLASGLPGIVCFYAAMDHAFPHKQWDNVAHQYLKQIVQMYEEEGIGGYSLFYGLTGICFAGHLCSKEMRYQQLLRKLNTFLIDEIEQNLIYIHKNLIQTDGDQLPSHYNLTEGLSGVIAYLLLRQDDRLFQKITIDCIDALIALLSKERMIGNDKVVGWLVSQKNEIFDIETEEFSQGGFILSTPFNIVGCLSVLSLAAWYSSKPSPALQKAIRKIADWLSQQQIKTPEGKAWPYIFSFKSTKNYLHSQSALSQGAWSYGRPAVATSLYLAGKALQDKTLMSFAEESFASQFIPRQNSSAQQDYSISFGKGGLLATTYLMAKQTNHSLLVREVSRLEKEVKDGYHPNFPFGFQRTNGLGNHHLNDPGLFNGAVGSALALLLVAGLTEPVSWERAFLLR